MRRDCLVCGRRAVHAHHVAYRQWAKDTAGDLNDPRNLAAVCQKCHFDHHAAARRIPRALLPDETVSYIEELGPRIVARFERTYPEELT